MDICLVRHFYICLLSPQGKNNSCSWHFIERDGRHNRFRTLHTLTNPDSEVFVLSCQVVVNSQTPSTDHHFGLFALLLDNFLV